MFLPLLLTAVFPTVSPEKRFKKVKNAKKNFFPTRYRTHDGQMLVAVERLSVAPPRLTGLDSHRSRGTATENRFDPTGDWLDSSRSRGAAARTGFDTTAVVTPRLIGL